MKLSWLAQFGCCLVLAAALVPSHAATFEVRYEANPVKQVFQQDGESWDDFVSRAARVMRDYTSQTDFEAGGWLCIHPGSGKGAISVISSQSQISVSASIKGCPLGGYRLTTEFMHSHPVKEYIVLNDRDLHAYPMGKMARFLGGMRAGSRVHVGASGGRFSKADIEIGPGYLVHGENLYYQSNGRQQFKRTLGADAGPGIAQMRVASH